MSDLTGQQWGDYRLARLIGRGSFAEVYAGEHIQTRMRAALKIFSTPLPKQAADAFRDEAQSLARLAHPYLLRLLTFDIQRGRPFLVLDYAPNGTLAQRHPYGARLPQAQAIVYVRQIAGALQTIHAAHLVHGLLKPENVLLGNQNELLISDTGLINLVRLVSPESSPLPISALPYIAPEQIQGHEQPASDQYSLAVIAYQWLSGLWPFQGTPDELMRQHLSTRPPSLLAKAPDLPVEVEQVIMTALSKDPTQRFRSVLAFANALAQAIGEIAATPVAPQSPAGTPPPAPTQTWSGSAVPTNLGQAMPGLPAPGMAFPALPPGQPAYLPPSPAPQSTLLSRRNLLIAGGSVAGLAAIGAGVGVWLHFKSQPAKSQTITPPAPTRPVLIYTDMGQAKLSHGGKRILDSGNTVIWSRDSKRIISLAGDKADGEQIRTWDVLNGKNAFIYRFTHYENNDNIVNNWDIVWRQQIPFLIWTDHTLIRVVNLDTGQQIMKFSGIFDNNGQGYIPGVYWSPDGWWIAAVENNNRDFNRDALHVWNTASGKLAKSFAPPYSGNRSAQLMQGSVSMQWSPDSQRIISWGLDCLLHVWNAHTGELLYTYTKYADANINEDDIIENVIWSPDSQYVASWSGNSRAITIWKATDGKQAATLKVGKFPYYVLWSPDSQMIATAEEVTGTTNEEILLKVWKANTGAVIFSQSSAYGSVAAWSPDSKRLATNGPSKIPASTASFTTDVPATFTVWDAATGKNAVKYSGPVYSDAYAYSSLDYQAANARANTIGLYWSPDGQYIAQRRYLDFGVLVWKVA